MKDDRETSQSSAIPTPVGEASIWQLIDREATLRRLGNDESLFLQLVDFFLEDHPPLMEHLESAIAEHDATKMERAAHSLKGLTSNLGATAVTQWAAGLETSGRQNDLSQATVLHQGLKTELTTLVQALKRHRSIPSNS